MEHCQSANAAISSNVQVVKSKSKIRRKYSKTGTGAIEESHVDVGATPGFDENFEMEMLIGLDDPGNVLASNAGTVMSGREVESSERDGQESSDDDDPEDDSCHPPDNGVIRAEDEMAYTAGASCKESSVQSADKINDKQLMMNGELKDCTKHTRPKKSMSDRIRAEDYICTDSDRDVIEYYKKIPKIPGLERLVLIDGVQVLRKHMESLFQPNQYLGDEIIDAYINLTKAQEGLKSRSGGTVLLENVITTAYMKTQGEDNNTINANYTECSTAQLHWFTLRALDYLDHDMVFLPVNVPNRHWYLGVINSKKHRIQVIDSLGRFDTRGDLKTMLVGLRRHLEFALEKIVLKRHNWPDVKVDEWRREEIFQRNIQCDGVSCGLFLISFMEFWTGSELSDEVTQDYMEKFRFKLAPILLSSEFNKLKGTTHFDSDNENTGSPSDLAVIDNPNTDKTSMKKRKHSEGAECLEGQNGKAIPSKNQEIVSQIAPRTYAEELLAFQDMKDMPMNNEELTDLLCDYIMSFEDEEKLKKKMVKGFYPTQINLTMKNLQHLLTQNRSIFQDCFNLGVRFQAYREYKRLKRWESPIKHHMDLRFCIKLALSTEEKYRKKYTREELGAAIDVCEECNYFITQCRYFLLPWLHQGNYMLYVFDHVKRMVTMIDPRPVEDWCTDTPVLMYAELTLGFRKQFKQAMNEHNPGWNEDIFKWKFSRAPGLPQNIKPSSSGYFILQYINAWGSNEKNETNIYTDDMKMRQNMLVDLLAHERNGYRGWLPEIIKHYLHRITEKNIR